MKKQRLAIYACFDANNKVDLADIFYLEALKDVADTVIYVADNELDKEEEKKLAGLATVVLAKRHGEYDFGSYKRGFFYAKAHGLLNELDELILCNDSCYAPLFPFAPIFAAMENKSCDFWSLTENYEFYHHYQSFFLVFRPKVFESALFQDFLSNVKSEKYVQAVIQKYEIGLSKLLIENGFNGESYIPYPTTAECPQLKGKKLNLMQFPLWLFAKGMPLLKKKALFDSVANQDGFVKAYKAALYYNFELWKVFPPIYKLYGAEILKIRRFFFQKKITSSGNLLIKICKIPVCSIHIGDTQ